jgi:cell division protein FtsN
MARDPDDDLPWLAEGVREERSTLVPRARLFGGGLIVVALVVLVGLGVYLASGHKSDGSAGYVRAEDAPLIAADAGAYKVAPTDPGGARITGIDDSVAAVAGGRDQGSAILPDEPEEPIARPGAPGAAATAGPPTDLLPATIPPAATAPAASPPRAIAVAPIPTAPITAAPVVAPKPVAATPALKPAPDAVSAAKAVKPTKTTAADKPEAKTEATPAAKPHADRLAAIGADLATPAKPIASKPATKAAAGGSITLQLGAFSTRDKADAAWTKAGGDGALSGLAKRVEPVDRDGTTLYRLRAGGVVSKEAAAALCTRLKAAGNACVIAE